MQSLQKLLSIPYLTVIHQQPMGDRIPQLIILHSPEVQLYVGERTANLVSTVSIFQLL